MLKILFKHYYRLRETDFVWRYLLNRRSGFLYRNDDVMKVLDETTRAIIAELQTDGISVRHISDFGFESVFEQLWNLTREYWDREEVQERLKNSKNFFESNSKNTADCYLIDLLPTHKELNIEDPFIKFNLNEQVLRIVNGYMEMYTKLLFWELKCTIFQKYTNRPIQSQVWHRDRGDKKMLKVFLYLNDVDETNGPFMYLKYSHNGGKWNEIYPRVAPVGGAGNEKLIPTNDVKTCSGAAGTIIFADTSGLHRGGIISSPEKKRFMHTSAFVSNASVWPRRYSNSRLGVKDRSHLMPSAEYAVNYPHTISNPPFYRDILSEMNAKY